jgi:hypothetical protein
MATLLRELKGGERFRFVGEAEVYVVKEGSPDGQGAVHVYLADRNKWLWIGPAVSSIRPDEPVERV